MFSHNPKDKCGRERHADTGQYLPLLTGKGLCSPERPPFEIAYRDGDVLRHGRAVRTWVDFAFSFWSVIACYGKCFHSFIENEFTWCNTQGFVWDLIWTNARSCTASHRSFTPSRVSAPGNSLLQQQGLPKSCCNVSKDWRRAKPGDCDFKGIAASLEGLQFCWDLLGFKLLQNILFIKQTSLYRRKKIVLTLHCSLSSKEANSLYCNLLGTLHVCYVEIYTCIYMCVCTCLFI